MATKTLFQIRRGDQIVTPKGNVTVTSFSINWAEDFGNSRKGTTVTVVGTLNGKNVRMTGPETNTVEVA